MDDDDNDDLGGGGAGEGKMTHLQTFSYWCIERGFKRNILKSGQRITLLFQYDGGGGQNDPSNNFFIISRARGVGEYLGREVLHLLGLLVDLQGVLRNMILTSVPGSTIDPRNDSMLFQVIYVKQALY